MPPQRPQITLQGHGNDPESVTATIKQRDPGGIESRGVAVCVRANTSSPSPFIPVRNQQGHLGLALNLHSSPEMDSSGGQNQILICKARAGKRGSERRRYLGTLTSG